MQSPDVKRIVQQRLAASLENESTGIRRLEPLLLFAGEDKHYTVSRAPIISSKLNYRSIEARVSRTNRPQRINRWQGVKGWLARGISGTGGVEWSRRCRL